MLEHGKIKGYRTNPRGEVMTINRPKTNVIGVTGARVVGAAAAAVRVAIAEAIAAADGSRCRVFVGDAIGVDAIAREVGEMWAYGVALFEAEGRQPWQLQQRSKNMIDSLAKAGGTLHAWPNKLCPDGITLSSWKGSGTWGTVYYAHLNRVPVVVHGELMPGGYELPGWLTFEDVEQLRLVDSLLEA